jgi:hypothetical protein
MSRLLSCILIGSNTRTYADHRIILETDAAAIAARVSRPKADTSEIVINEQTILNACECLRSLASSFLLRLRSSPCFWVGLGLFFASLPLFLASWSIECRVAWFQPENSLARITLTQSNVSRIEICAHVRFLLQRSLATAYRAIVDAYAWCKLCVAGYTSGASRP